MAPSAAALSSVAELEWWSMCCTGILRTGGPELSVRRAPSTRCGSAHSTTSTDPMPTKLWSPENCSCICPQNPLFHRGPATSPFLVHLTPLPVCGGGSLPLLALLLVLSQLTLPCGMSTTAAYIVRRRPAAPREGACGKTLAAKSARARAAPGDWAAASVIVVRHSIACSPSPPALAATPLPTCVLPSQPWPRSPRPHNRRTMVRRAGRCLSAHAAWGQNDAHYRVDQRAAGA